MVLKRWANPGGGKSHRRRVGKLFGALGKNARACIIPRAGLALLLVTTGGRPAASQTPPAGDLADMSLEQLLEIQVVSTSSKRPQLAREAPSVVTVVTGEEIRHHGHRTLGDVLRTLPGLYVTYDRNYSYLGVRGFGRPGDYNTRVLLLVDGVRTNDNVYDGAYVARDFLLDPELIERVEVSRGPGASVYGNSALFAVINVVTKRGAQLGSSLSVAGASFGTREGRVTFGESLANGAELALSAALHDSDGPRLYFPELDAPETNGGVVRGADWERGRKLFASFTRGGFSTEALHSFREKGIPTGSYGTIVGDPRAKTLDTWTLLTTRYEASFGDGFDWTARLTFGAYDYAGAYPYGAGSVAVYEDDASGRWWNAESTGTVRAGRHTLLVGSEVQWDSRQDQGGGYAGSPPDLQVRDRSSRFAVFAQDDLQLAGALRLSLGARFDRYPGFGGEAHPRAALIVSPGAHTTMRVLYGSSFRAPNEYEQHYYAAQEAGLEPERMRTLEASVERTLGGSARVAATLFSNDIRRLLTLDSTESDELLFHNAGRITSRGGEISLDARFAGGLAGGLSYSYQRTRDQGGAALTNSPRHMLKARLSAPLLEGAARASLDAQYVSSRRTLSGGETTDFVLLNATLYLGRIGRHIEASASVYNLLGVRYSDPGSEEHRQDAIPQDGRSFALRATWRF